MLFLCSSSTAATVLGICIKLIIPSCILAPPEAVKIKKGIFIGSGEKGKAEILSQKKVKNKFHIRMILRQGKKNEIRRIFKFSNIKLLSLKRVKFGDIALGDLKEGFWRELTKKEKEYLKKVRLK